MNKALAGLILLLGLASPALAQQVVNPLPNAGVYGAYNSSAPTCVTGTGCWIQTDINGNLKVTIQGGGGGGLSVTDQTAFVQGTSAFTPTGGVFNDTATLASGQEGTVRLTTDRQMKVLDSAVLAAVQSSIPAGTNTIGTVGWLPYPVGAVPITASATGTTAATTATLAANATLKTYLCSYSIRANATAAATVTNTITGVVTGTLSHIMWIAPLASGLGVDEQIFNPCVPSSAVNTAIAVVSGAPGSGGLVSSTATGYQAP